MIEIWQTSGYHTIKFYQVPATTVSESNLKLT